MSKTFSLQPLLELMQTRTDEATRRLGRLIAEEQSAQSRLALLEQYREEYNQRFRDASQNGMTPLSWRNFQDFLGRIDEAVAQQQRIVASSKQNTVAGQNHWQSENKRLKAIDTLADRHQASERYREGKLEQKFHDELATRPPSQEE